MEMSFIAGFWVVSFLLIITPGADWAYTISAGIHGQRVLPAVIGLMSGHLLAAIIVIAGIGVAVTGHPLVLSLITLLGAAYLLWLGIAILRHPATPGAATQQAGSWNRWALKGLCISGLNPKVFLLFLALLPQFTDPAGRWPVALQMSALGSIHLLTCTLIYFLVGYGSKRLLTHRPEVARRVSMTSGAMMVAIAILLFCSQLK
ncbi:MULTISPECIES: LysE family translocator [Raoultella]|jgi:threonine/homoserine/homoserine lactone efflux protein|uniref:Leucine export protein LeuE n=2 Tax=Raoultella planticola TaxID=575 RepID=A0A2X2EAA5_RAOPL|nr:MULTISPECIES: LysE family translocator [Raoultella]EJR0222273.1 LysE family translocator [Raoultella planticola]EJR0351820.1 LysE family translocator [Raoultella planticola]EKW5589071.1 LysE family translocator [Raoultella planticola]ELC3570525.1 LysE family translocator [Raoultella planticola]ELF4969989.1 LysE family translocator [Raoultella planticola]